MRQNIPDFEGARVNAATMSFQGSKVFPVYAFGQGEEVFLIVKATVKSVDHVERAKVGLVREHKLTLAGIVVPDQRESKANYGELLAAFEERHAGKLSLPFKGDGDADGDETPDD